MKKTYIILFVGIFIGTFFLVGCGKVVSVSNVSSVASEQVTQPEEAPIETLSQGELPPSSNVESNTEKLTDNDLQSAGQQSHYFDNLAKAAISNIDITDDDTDFEIIEKIYVYLVENTDILPHDNITLTNSWRAFYDGETPPTFYEALSTGLFEYNLASCEHYAAALMVLLEYMDFETRYVPGLTYSVSGEMVIHAWTMVKVDDVWYHLDANLEDHISQQYINFKYFMKDDETFAASHAWGDMLLNPNEYDLSLPECLGKVDAIEGYRLIEPLNRLTLNQAQELATKYIRDAGDDLYELDTVNEQPPFPQTNELL